LSVAIAACALASAVWPQADFAAKAAREPGAVVTPSGLVFRSLKEGSGPQPQASDKVRVNYRGSFADGKEFDSSYARGQPAEFRSTA